MKHSDLTIFYFAFVAAGLTVLAQACQRAATAVTHSSVQVATASAKTHASPRGASPAATNADTPRLFLPGFVSTPEHDEGGLHVTPFGEVYFWRRLPGEKQKIYVYREWRDGDSLRRTAPEIASFSTDRDENAFLTQDGLVCYFGSERAIAGRPNLGNFDMNVWVTRRDSIGGVWSEPEPLGPYFNLVQREGENWPVANASRVVSLDDERYYVATTPRGDSASRLFVYRRDASDELADPQRVDGLFADPRYSVGGPALTPDGRYLFFSSYGAPGGEGGEDIYVSRRAEDGGWSPAVALAAVNTENEEAGPSVSPDGKLLYFGSARVLDAGTWSYAPWEIKEIAVAALGLERVFSCKGATGGGEDDDEGGTGQ